MTLSKLLSLLLFFLLPFHATVIGEENKPESAPPSEIPLPLEGGSSERTATSFFDEFMNMLLTLCFIILLITLMAWIIKRLINQKMLSGNKGSLIQVIERRALAPKAALYLIQVKDQTVLVGESPAGLHHITELSSKSFKDIYAQNQENQDNKES